MNAINSTAINSSENLGWLDSFAKTQLLKRLLQMPRGTLLIEEGDELHRFGDPEDTSGIKAKIVIEDASTYRDIVSAIRSAARKPICTVSGAHRICSTWYG